MPTHGDLALHPDGSFSYTPTANYAGTDTFPYKARNAYGSTSHPATVTINPDPRQRHPVCQHPLRQQRHLMPKLDPDACRWSIEVPAG
jgi:hypothetical protein